MFDKQSQCRVELSGLFVVNTEIGLIFIQGSANFIILNQIEAHGKLCNFFKHEKLV